MAHWRKAHQAASHINAIAGRVVGTAVLLGALAFLARHIHV
jgi:hypothetical protein